MLTEQALTSCTSHLPAPPSPAWMRLRGEVWWVVLGFVTVQDILCHVTLTCRSFHEMVRHYGRQWRQRWVEYVQHVFDSRVSLVGTPHTEEAKRHADTAQDEGEGGEGGEEDGHHRSSQLICLLLASNDKCESSKECGAPHTSHNAYSNNTNNTRTLIYVSPFLLQPARQSLGQQLACAAQTVVAYGSEFSSHSPCAAHFAAAIKQREEGKEEDGAVCKPMTRARQLWRAARGVLGRLREQHNLAQMYCRTLHRLAQAPHIIPAEDWLEAKWQGKPSVPYGSPAPAQRTHLCAQLRREREAVWLACHLYHSEARLPELVSGAERRRWLVAQHEIARDRTYTGLAESESTTQYTACYLGILFPLYCRRGARTVMEESAERCGGIACDAHDSCSNNSHTTTSNNLLLSAASAAALLSYGYTHHFHYLDDVFPDEHQQDEQLSSVYHQQHDNEAQDRTAMTASVSNVAAVAAAAHRTAVQSGGCHADDLLAAIYPLRHMLPYFFLLEHTTVLRLQDYRSWNETKCAVYTRLVSPTADCVELRFFYRYYTEAYPMLYTNLVFSRSNHQSDKCSSCCSLQDKIQRTMRCTGPEDAIAAHRRHANSRAYIRHVCVREESIVQLAAGGYGRVEVDKAPEVSREGFVALRAALGLAADFPLALLWNAVLGASGVAVGVLRRHRAAFVQYYKTLFTDAAAAAFGPAQCYGIADP